MKLHKDRNINQRNRIKDLRSKPGIYGQLIFSKVLRTLSEKMIDISTNGSEKNWIYMIQKTI
jgi:hypothetical protein